MQCHKYTALGNSYFVWDTAATPWTDELKKQIPEICRGQTDGLLVGPLPSLDAHFKVRIFNPDGSEAEKSGNGVRIFAKYLLDSERITHKPFTLETLGGIVTCKVPENSEDVSADLGPISFVSNEIPMTGPTRRVLEETLNIEGTSYTICAANIGNPHCIIRTENPTESLAKSLGPKFETHPDFPEKTNVQFLEILDKENIKIYIWERGAGYTLSSGTSASAAAAVAHKVYGAGSKINVHMPGGILNVKLNSFSTIITGPVKKQGSVPLAITCT